MNQLSFVSHDLSVSSVKTDVIWTISNYEVFLFVRKVLAMVCLKNDVFSCFFTEKLVSWLPLVLLFLTEPIAFSRK